MNHRSASNNQIKLLKKLLMRKYRLKEELFIAEGVRCVEQILENGFIHVKEIFVDEAVSDRFSFIPASIPVSATDAETLSDVSDTENTQGILAVCEIPGEKSPAELAGSNGIIVAMDAIQDPGNAGTIIRTAAWFGAAGIISGKGTVDIYHPKVVRSTAGATGCLPVLNGSLDELLAFFKENGWSVCLLDGGPNSVDIRAFPVEKRQMIVIGNEGNGIQRSILESGYPAVRIPGHNDVVESLNAAVAGSIGLFHLSGAGEPGS